MAKLGEHAVVLGASMGGLLAARLLADFYGMVTVFERDVLPHDPANRRGVPQGRHVHALLNRGAQLLDELFPGFLNELVAAGATVLDDGDPAKGYFSFGGHEMVRSGTVRDPEAMALYLASRPFLECHVRRRLQTVENVTILGGRDVVESTSTADRTRVTGVRVAERNGGHEHELAANLVVDATGRGSRTPTLLESLGYGRPVGDHVFVHHTYVTQLLRTPPGSLEERIVIIGATSGRPTGLFLSAYEDDAWMFTSGGWLGTHRPATVRACCRSPGTSPPPTCSQPCGPPNLSQRRLATVCRPVNG